MTSHQKRRLRGACKTNARRTRCVNGHPFTDANTYIHTPPGRRYPRRFCRRCNADRAAARKHRQPRRKR